MSAVPVGSNPFALLMEPEVVVALVERSVALASLRRRIHRPLDKPQTPHVEDADPVAFWGSPDAGEAPDFGATN